MVRTFIFTLLSGYVNARSSFRPTPFFLLQFPTVLAAMLPRIIPVPILGTSVALNVVPFGRQNSPINDFFSTLISESPPRLIVLLSTCAGCAWSHLCQVTTVITDVSASLSHIPEELECVVSSPAISPVVCVSTSRLQRRKKTDNTELLSGLHSLKANP
jgi:hypothetical protein